MPFSKFGHRVCQVPEHTVVGLSLSSSTHISVHDISAPTEAEAKEGRKENSTRDVEINSATDTEEHTRREGPTTDDAHGCDYRIADESLNTKCKKQGEMEVQRLWEEDLNIYMEKRTLCMQVLTTLSKMKGMWSDALVRWTLESTTSL